MNTIVTLVAHEVYAAVYFTALNCLKIFDHSMCQVDLNNDKLNYSFVILCYNTE